MSRKNDMRRTVDEVAKIGGPSVEYTGTQSPNPNRACAISLIRRTLLFPLAAISAGGTLAATASPYQQKMRYPGRVLGACLLPAGASTANDTNYQGINVVKNGTTTMAAMTTKTSASGGTGSLVAGTPVDLTLDATVSGGQYVNQRFAKGDVLAPSVTAAGTGVAIAACTLQVEVEMEGPIDDFAV